MAAKKAPKKKSKAAKKRAAVRARPERRPRAQPLPAAIPAAPVVAAPIGQTRTFRDLLNAGIYECLEREDMVCASTQPGLVDLVVSLARYREEGVPLFPKFIICDNLAASLLLVRGEDPVELGCAERSAATFRAALKKCAPLAPDGWVAYIHRTEDKFHFGVFRQAPSPTAVAIRDAIYVGAMEGAPKLVYVAQVAENVVEIVGAKGGPMTLHLTAAHQSTKSPIATLQKLVEHIVDAVPQQRRESVSTFVIGLLTNALRRGHGALVAVLSRASIPELNQDAVWLQTPIDLDDAVTKFQTDESVAALARLNSYATLVEGMLSSDGITVFRTNAQVLGFRSFIQRTGEPALASAATTGARGRAFNALRSLVDTHDAVAAFMRSADGRTEIYDGVADAE